MSPQRGRPDGRAHRRTRRDGADTWIPNIAVAAMAVVAVVTAVMVTRSQRGHDQEEALAAPPAQSASAPVATSSLLPTRPIPPEQSTVVQAPALHAPSAGTQRSADASRDPTHVLGNASGCTGCGTVQTVVAVRKRQDAEPSSYQMQIRMDDGTERMVEQRGALPAGSRVQLDGDVVRAVPRSG